MTISNKMFKAFIKDLKEMDNIVSTCTVRLLEIGKIKSTDNKVLNVIDKDLLSMDKTVKMCILRMEQMEKFVEEGMK